MKQKILILFAAVTLLLCGCSSHSFRLVEKEAGDFTYYLADQKVTSHEPVIILCHGLGGDHTDMETAAELFYDNGYTVVTFDLYGNPEETYDSDVCIDEMIEALKSASATREPVKTIFENVNALENFVCKAAFHLAHFSNQFQTLR